MVCNEYKSKEDDVENKEIKMKTVRSRVLEIIFLSFLVLLFLIYVDFN